MKYYLFWRAGLKKNCCWIKEGIGYDQYNDALLRFIEAENMFPYQENKIVSQNGVILKQSSCKGCKLCISKKDIYGYG